MKRQYREKNEEYISFILKPCDLKFGMHVVKTLYFETSRVYIMYISLKYFLAIGIIYIYSII